MRLRADELNRFGEELGRSLAAPVVIGLSGELGSGKTTLVQAICRGLGARALATSPTHGKWLAPGSRSEEHTSELQSQSNLVCRLLLEKKKHGDHRDRGRAGRQTRDTHGPLLPPHFRTSRARGTPGGRFGHRAPDARAGRGRLATQYV